MAMVHAPALFAIGVLLTPPVTRTPSTPERLPAGAVAVPIVQPERQRAAAAHRTGRPLTPSSESPAALQHHGSSKLAGEYLINSPNVFRGVSADGKVTELPAVLAREETLELIQSAWFYLSSSDARRELLERAAEKSAAATYDPTHDEIIACMRARSALAVEALRRSQGSAQRQQKGIAARVVATTCQLLFPEKLSDTEFRLRESVGRCAYNKLFLHHQRLIYYEVNKLLPNWQSASVMEKADFLQEGAQGLLRAIRLFDLAKGVQFSTYAVWHIRAYVLRGIRDKGRLVRLPQALQQDMIQIRKARYRYAVENQGCAPDEQQLASLLQWSSQRVSGALTGLASSETVSLDAVIDHKRWSKGTLSLMDTQHASQTYSPEAVIYKQQLGATLRRAQCERDPKRARITRLKYGLEDGKEWTYPQLAALFNITANGAKNIVRSEVAFLRREKRAELQHFVASD